MAEAKTVKVVNEMDDEVMSIEDLGVEGDRVYVYGSLMGAWKSKMYIDIDGLLTAVQLVLNRPELIGYVARAPKLVAERAEAAE